MWNDGVTFSHHCKAFGGRVLFSSVIMVDFPLSKLLFSNKACPDSGRVLLQRSASFSSDKAVILWICPG